MHVPPTPTIPPLRESDRKSLSLFYDPRGTDWPFFAHTDASLTEKIRSSSPASFFSRLAANREGVVGSLGPVRRADHDDQDLGLPVYLFGFAFRAVGLFAGS